MEIVDIGEAKRQLSQIVYKVAAGAEVIIAKAGKPVARLVPLAPAAERPKRRLGTLEGEAIVPPDFDAPLPDDVLNAFAGGGAP